MSALVCDRCGSHAHDCKGSLADEFAAVERAALALIGTEGMLNVEIAIRVLRAAEVAGPNSQTSAPSVMGRQRHRHRIKGQGVLSEANASRNSNQFHTHELDPDREVTNEAFESSAFEHNHQNPWYTGWADWNDRIAWEEQPDLRNGGL